MAEVYWQEDALAKVLAEAEALRDDTLIPLVIADMKRLVPVDSGDLLKSIEPGDDGKILIGEEYGKFVEFGTHIMEAQPFARPALYRRRDG